MGETLEDFIVQEVRYLDTLKSLEPLIDTQLKPEDLELFKTICFFYKFSELYFTAEVLSHPETFLLKELCGLFNWPYHSLAGYCQPINDQHYDEEILITAFNDEDSALSSIATIVGLLITVGNAPSLPTHMDSKTRGRLSLAVTIYKICRRYSHRRSIKGFNPICASAECGNFWLFVKSLIWCGADARDDLFNNSFHIAVERGFHNIARLCSNFANELPPFFRLRFDDVEMAHILHDSKPSSATLYTYTIDNYCRNPAVFNVFWKKTHGNKAFSLKEDLPSHEVLSPWFINLDDVDEVSFALTRIKPGSKFTCNSYLRDDRFKDFAELSHLDYHPLLVLILYERQEDFSAFIKKRFRLNLAEYVPLSVPADSSLENSKIIWAAMLDFCITHNIPYSLHFQMPLRCFHFLRCSAPEYHGARPVRPEFLKFLLRTFPLPDIVRAFVDTESGLEHFRPFLLEYFRERAAELEELPGSTLFLLRMRLAFWGVMPS